MVRVSTLRPLLVLAASSAVAGAAPAADLVVVWAPGARIAPVEAVARRLGVAVIDKTPAPPATAHNAQLLQQGIDAYEALQFDAAWTAFAPLLSEVDRTGAEGLTRAQLSDLFLYRALVKTQQGDATTAWDELLEAVKISPTRDLDPARFPPRVIEELARAKETVQKGAHAQLDVRAPPGCTVIVDGETASAAVDRPVGPHWFRVTCPDREPFGQRLELTAGAGTIPISPAPYTPPSDTDVLIQARSAGAHAVVVAEVHDQIATLRLVGIDGRERDRRSVTITGDLGPLADAIADLLTPPVKTHWYQTRWAWAAGAAALAGVIVIPITAAIASRHGASDGMAVFKGPLPP